MPTNSFGSGSGFQQDPWTTQRPEQTARITQPQASPMGFQSQGQGSSAGGWGQTQNAGWAGFNPYLNLPMLSNPSLTWQQKNDWLTANPGYQMNSYQMDPSVLARMNYEQQQGIGGWNAPQQSYPQQQAQGQTRLDFNPMYQQQNYGNQMGNVNPQAFQILLQLLSLLGGR
jgi:hypothetical protein